jgi:molybdopterin converting factor small subunit
MDAEESASILSEWLRDESCDATTACHGNENYRFQEGDEVLVIPSIAGG